MNEEENHGTNNSSLSGLTKGSMGLHQEYRFVLRDDGKHHLEIFQEKNAINRHSKYITLRLDTEQIETLRLFLNETLFGRV
ncbi:MAG: hypothetical protein ACXAB2_06640 [Candidatus Hodarchaeales archaeon]|jgi:hypothetical protein